MAIRQIRLLVEGVTNSFLDDQFLLDTKTSRRLYHDFAEGLPIIDYHSHLPPAEIAGRKRYRNITELWLGGDHYKWRLMRAAGVPERLITGDGDDREKFLAFCRILPLAAGNPVYHFSHLELRRIFESDSIINEQNGPELWEHLNERLSLMDSWSFLGQAKVEVACTTDDPTDGLRDHRAIKESGLATRVLPAFRPDKAMRINESSFIPYLEKLGRTTGIEVNSFATLIQALEQRIKFFHSQGGRLSDHAIDLSLPAKLAGDSQVEQMFSRRMAGETLPPEMLAQYVATLLLHLGRAYFDHGWAMCLHIGALRNTNTRQLKALGPDTGFDSISDFSSATGLAHFLDLLEQNEQLPKTVLFCSNPNMNEVLSTMIGNFQDGSIQGKLQFGPAWWFNDQKDGNLAQLKLLANHGVLGTFIGMVTDSRSFASYPRHDFFRRLLCRLLGSWIEGGEYPDDAPALERLIEGVCYQNAKNYFGF